MKDSATKQNTHLPENSFSDNDIAAARNLANLLLLAWKNYSFYPEGHVAAIKALENLKAAFEDFFSDHSFLRLTIEKNRFLLGTAVVHEIFQDAPSDHLISILFRDGIQWLAFHRDLPMDELVYFFSTLNRYRMLAEETEGDIVTGLTDGCLDKIDFKAVDIFWDKLPLLDFETLDTRLPQTEEPDSQAAPGPAAAIERAEGVEIQAKSIADPAISENLWKISDAEQEKLQEMVREEEHWNNTEDVLDVLMVILRSQTDRYSFSSVLDFTREEVVDTIQHGEFSSLLNLFQALYHLLYRDAVTELEWRRPLIERFFQDLSQPEKFDHITAKLVMLHDDDTEEIKALRQILLYFSPSTILLLGPVVLKTEFPLVRKMIMEVIEYLSLKDMSPLEVLLDHPDQKLAEILLPLFGRLRGERSTRIFFKMSEHDSEKVRDEAVRILLNRDHQSIMKLFPLINDPSLKIRRHILAGIAFQKSSVLENQLLKHITENAEQNKEHVLACYEALGHCGSDKSIPYLRKVLLASGWNSFFGLGKAVHRKGAATALALLNSPQAEDTLLKASKSRFKVIREAARPAALRKAASGEAGNG